MSPEIRTEARFANGNNLFPARRLIMDAFRPT